MSHSRALKQATMHYLQQFWDLDDCEVKVTAPPGKPLGCMSSWAITIYDTPQNFEGKIGLYPRYGCNVILSAKLNGERVEDPADFLDEPRTGFNDTKDALIAFLHSKRWDVLKWANILAFSATGAPNLITTNMVESPIPKQAGNVTARQADWWGDDRPKVTKGARTEESFIVGYSVEIFYAGALTMLNETPKEY